MTKTRSTKRALLMSGLALLMCVSMLIGSTFAWFTDSVTSAGNKIVAGTLDVQLLMDADIDGDYDDISDSTAPIFGTNSLATDSTNTLWEPGKTQVAYLAIKNNGSLDLKYTVGLNVQNASKDLYEVMEYAIVPDADANNKVTAWNGGNSVVVGTQSVAGDVTLAKGATHYFALVIHMDENAGNKYQGGEVNFDLTVLATQVASESDSFGNQYDKDATCPAISIADKTDATALTLTEGIFSITVPAEANNGKYAIEVANNVIKTNADGKTTLSFDLSLTKDGTDVADGSAIYTVAINVGVGKIIDRVTHNGNAVANYTYNSATGIVTFTTDSFSPFAIEFRPDPAFGKAAMVDGVYYTTFADALNAADEGDTIAIVNDINSLEVQIKKAITLDLGDNTINEAWIRTYADVTIQNGSIKNVDEPYPVDVKGGTLTIENVDIEASKSDRAIWLDSKNAVLNFNSGSILATKGANNTIYSTIYGIWVTEGATANINGGTIEVDAGAKATAIAIGGNYSNTVNVNDGRISTSGSTKSQAIYTKGNVTVSGGEIVTNEKRYGNDRGITYGNNYAINTTGNVTVSGGKITTYGYGGNLAYIASGGSNQKVVVSNVDFTNVLTETDKTVGGHSAPNLIYGPYSSSTVNAEITSGSFKGVNAELTKNVPTTAVSGGTFDVAINSKYLAEGYSLIDNGDGTWTVAK